MKRLPPQATPVAPPAPTAPTAPTAPAAPAALTGPPDTPPYAVLSLLTGIEARLRRPTLYAMLATVGSVPNQLMLDVLNMLEEDGVPLDKQPPGKKFLYIRNKYRGMYALAALLIEWPRLVLDPEVPNREAGEIGEEDISLDEVEWIYLSYFRRRHFTPYRPPAAPAEPGGAPEPPPPGDDVPGPLAA